MEVEVTEVEVLVEVAVKEAVEEQEEGIGNPRDPHCRN